ncbi:hypothetical protein RKD56_000508, partial [Priestia megaterium]
SEDLRSNPSLYNEISDIFLKAMLEELKAKGYDNDQVRMKVNNIRLMIREHLERFNPFQ